MKQVYGSDEIPHLWAHKTQQSARNKQGNFYFDGHTIYSYGRHFPIARHVTNKRKQEAVLFTMQSNSHTTNGHIHMVRRAVSHLTILYVPEVRTRFNLATNLKDTLSDFANEVIKAQRDCFGPTGRFRPKAWEALERLLPKANAYAAFAGSRKRWTMPETSDAIRDSLARAKAAEDRASRANHKRYLAAEARRNAERMANLQLWMDGADMPHYADLPRDPVALRVRNEVVETSLGAEVPIDHARLGLRFVRKCRDTHTPYQRNGHTLHLGHYAIDAIDELGNLRAGCHSITIEEIERIAPLLEA